MVSQEGTAGRADPKRHRVTNTDIAGIRYPVPLAIHQHPKMRPQVRQSKRDPQREEQEAEKLRRPCPARREHPALPRETRAEISIPCGEISHPAGGKALAGIHEDVWKAIDPSITSITNNIDGGEARHGERPAAIWA